MEPAEPPPFFKSPPVTEVLIGVQFHELDFLSEGFEIFKLWSECFADEFPEVKIQPPLSDQPPERFEGLADPQVRIIVGRPPVRLWFISKDEAHLLQLQNNRLIYNWRKQQDAYPRFEQVQARFAKSWATLERYLQAKGTGLLAEQCEVSYINTLGAQIGINDLGQIALSTEMLGTTSFKHLGSPELGSLQFRYLIFDEDRSMPKGRLYVSLKPKPKPSSYLLELTARGAPMGEGLQGVLRFAELAHEWIVRGFAEITPQAAHKLWERSP